MDKILGIVHFTTSSLSMHRVKITQLDDERFELINLRFFCGLKFKEIAVVLESKEANVKTRLYRTLEQIRKKVESCLATANN